MYIFSYKKPDCTCYQLSNGSCNLCHNNIIFPYLLNGDIYNMYSDVYEEVAELQNIILNDVMKIALKLDIDNVSILKSSYDIRIDFMSYDKDEYGRSLLRFQLLDNQLKILDYHQLRILNHQFDETSFNYLEYDQFLYAAVTSLKSIYHLQKNKNIVT